MGTRAKPTPKVPASKAMPSTKGAKGKGGYSFASSTIRRPDRTRVPYDPNDKTVEVADRGRGKSGPTVMIKPSKVGTFTAKAKAAGMAPLAYANHVMQNKSNFPAETVQQANFARNFGGASKQRAKGGAK